jgi:hypothetical protein
MKFLNRLFLNPDCLAFVDVDMELKIDENNDKHYFVPKRLKMTLKNRTTIFIDFDDES